MGSDASSRHAVAAAALAAATGGGVKPPQPMPGSDTPGFAKGLAWLLRSTQRRPLTVAEARDKLLARELEATTVDAVLERAQQLKVLDDRAFADAWVADRGVNRGYGESRLRRELRRRGVEEPVIATAIAQLDEVDPYTQAFDLARARAQRMPASLEPPKVAQRLVGMLVRRGFSSEVAHTVARRVTALDRDWD